MAENNGFLGGYLLPHPPVIIPEVGGGRENEAAKTLAAYNYVSTEAARLKPDTVVVISPHAPLFSDYAFMYDSDILKGSFGQFGAPNAALEFEQDSKLRREIERSMKSKGIAGGALSEFEKERHNIDNDLDHGCLVPLYYFSRLYKSFRLVAMSCSGLDMQKLYTLGGIIKDCITKLSRRAVIIASGDMSHKAGAKSPYGFGAEGPVFDDAICKSVTQSDIPSILSVNTAVREKASECGYRSLVILCGAFDGERPKCRLLSYEAPFGIGYCAASFSPSGTPAPSAFGCAFHKANRTDIDIYTKIARLSLESYINKHTEISPSLFENCPEAGGLLKNKAGVFVSLKKFGELRGCIGTISPATGSIAEEIIENAVSAGTRDPRFDPVGPEELDYIEYSVDILSKAVPAVISELNPSKYGVIVRQGNRRGLLLPSLDGIDTVDKQLDTACRKAGINPNGKFDIFKFTVTRHSGVSIEGS